MQLANVESKLMTLNIDKDKYKNELEKIPDNAKTIAQRSRKEFLEEELKVIGRNISTMKQKLRDLGGLETGATAVYF